MSDSNKRRKIRIGDLLVQHRKISEQQLSEALAEQKRSGHKLGRTLVQLGYVSENEFLEFLAHQLDIPRVDLKHFKFKPDVVHKLPEKHARRFRALVLNERDDGLLVGMADPTDLFGFDELRRLLDKPLEIALVRESELVQAIDTIYRRTDEISSLAEEVAEDVGEEGYDLAELDAEASEDDAPVIRLLRSMFEDAVQINASDIHIEPGEKNLLIRQRVDGELQEQAIEGRRVASALVTRLKLMASLDISEKRLPQDGRFTIRVKDRGLDIRISTMPIQYGESVVMRLLDQSAGQLQFDGLGMPKNLRKRMQNLVQRDSGMIIVTGPTGSGKTTTLYAALNTINRPERKIITVEDPVEYRLPRINQVQVNSKIGLDFARVLRTALRQDPDVVMIGEMRDAETVEIGLRAAMTGHLVLSTLHTNNAVDSVVRLMDMGAEGYMIATSVTAVLAQRLIRRVCDSCGEPVEPTGREKAWLARFLDNEQIDKTDFFKGAGCTYCGNTGYRGRVGVYELLEIDDELADLLRSEDSNRFARTARNRDDYRPLLTSAVEHMLAGTTSIEDVLRLAGGLDAITDDEDGELPAPHLSGTAADSGTSAARDGGDENQDDSGDDGESAVQENAERKDDAQEATAPTEAPELTDSSADDFELTLSETDDESADADEQELSTADDSKQGAEDGIETPDPEPVSRTSNDVAEASDRLAQARPSAEGDDPDEDEARSEPSGDPTESLMEFASTRRRRKESDGRAETPADTGSSGQNRDRADAPVEDDERRRPAEPNSHADSGAEDGKQEHVSFTDFEGELSLSKGANEASGEDDENDPGKEGRGGTDRKRGDSS